jgi:phosphoenolpyruvate-protein phosphotransferase
MERIEITGEVISPGIFKGQLCFIDPEEELVRDRDTISKADVVHEIKRFETEASSVVKELEMVVRVLEQESYSDESDIVKTHILMLKDFSFHDSVHDQIRTKRKSAEIAIEHVLSEMVEALESSESEVVSERALDIRDILLRLKMKLMAEDSELFHRKATKVGCPVIVIRELFPSYVLEAKKIGVTAFVIERGTSLSHAAILAKSFGIPVLKIETIQRLKTRKKILVFVDAINGRLIVEPVPEDSAKDASESTDSIPFIGQNQRRYPLKVWINIADSSQIEPQLLEKVEGIGLYRTEYLFMKMRSNFPDEDEQFRAYSELFKRCPESPVTIRTLDIGGDKTLPYFSFGPQDNPYLGLRAHRVFRFHPEILITQFRAILKAAVNHSNLRIIYPMIETLDGLLFVQDLLDTAIASLKQDGASFNESFQQGILVEVPSAVWNFRVMLSHVDFASIGTNDLLQYFFAVDRNNANVHYAFEPENPGALKMIKYMLDIAKEQEKPLSVCGELASDISFLPIFVGLGVDQISIDTHAVQRVSASLAKIDTDACRQLAFECLSALRSSDVRVILNKTNASPRERHSDVDSESIDPICKMVVNTDDNTLMIKQGERRYYFCSKQCYKQFLNGEAPDTVSITARA